MIPCCCISLIATVLFVRGQSLKRDDDAKLREEGRQWAATHKGILHRKEKNTSVESPAEVAVEVTPAAVSGEKKTVASDVNEKT